MIGGGAIPKDQHGTEREALFSSLDWTPTLLRFAGVYNQISKVDRTWDGVVQYDLIMNGDDAITGSGRDHIVLNVGLSNLESAAVVFRYPEDDKLYKYIALNSDVDVLNRGDGWSIIDEDNMQIVFVSDDIEKNPDTADARGLDDKYLFNLEDDIAEEHNLLLAADADGDGDSEELVDYAKSLFGPYMEHPLYSENIKGLWNYLKEEDMTDQGILFTDPWMTDDEYFDYVTMIIKKQRHSSPVPDELLDLYTKPWSAPKHKESKRRRRRNEVSFGLGNMVSVNNVSFELYVVGIPIGMAVLLMYAAVSKCVLNQHEKNYANDAGMSSYGSV